MKNQAGQATFSRQFAVLFLSLRMVVFFSGAPVAAASVNTAGQPIVASEASNALDINQFLTLTNAARAEQGVAPLTLNNDLSTAAQAKAQDMAAKHYWAHFRPTDNKAPWDFIKESGYTYKVAGENLARGFRTPEGITKAWLNSPTHRANLISAKYQEVGFASIQTVDEKGETVLLTVQMFGSR